MPLTNDQLLERVNSGGTIETREEMTPEYFDNLLNLMTMQADSELAGAYGYVPWSAKAPTVEEKVIVAQIVKDEFRHAAVMYRLLKELGIDVDEHVRQHDYSMRVADPDAQMGAERAADDKRVNIFYYTIDNWEDFVMFNFLMDRGAGHQLTDALECSYGPWRRAITGIFKEEMMHVNHGDTWVERLAKDPATHDAVQASFDKWYPRTIAIFGRAKTKRNALYCTLGLKKRDNGEVRQAWIDEVVPMAKAWGLTIPEVALD